MLRIYREFLQKILIVLLYYQEMGYSTTHASRHVNDYVLGQNRLQLYPEPKDKESISRAVGWVRDGGVYCQANDIEDIVRLISGALNAKETGDDRDLIDTIVRVVGLPHTRNLLGYGSINSLRNALMVPDELQSLKSTLASEMSCFSCGHKFMNGEAATFSSHGGANGGGDWCCSRCSKPSFFAHDFDKSQSVAYQNIKGMPEIFKRKIGAPLNEEKKAKGAGLAAGHIEELYQQLNVPRAGRNRVIIQDNAAQPPQNLWGINAGVVFDPPPQPVPVPFDAAAPIAGGLEVAGYWAEPEDDN